MTDSNDNVVDLDAFRKKKNAPKFKLGKNQALEEFVEAYHEAGPEAIDIFNKAIMLFRAYGFETDDLDQRDVLLLREALFSIILRYREQHHPLHAFAEHFDKYFNSLEYYLDTDWSRADIDDPEDDRPA